ncbi:MULTISPECIES: WXG100 family type VII secretion target [unclassified Streptomyces]|uniref:hypothetical protein n=1 Tax=unclassified Streptomyces TaxID=2593676 RepID=UPI000C276275|nr:hypothetical protein [Streptomyces sp. CB02959]PJN41452.1 hypothetical protein CG747_06590 [Streptomyces sp. CB02959]
MAGSGYQIDPNVLRTQGKNFSDIAHNFGGSAEKFKSKVTECEEGWGDDSAKIVDQLLKAYKPVSKVIMMALPHLEDALGELGTKLNTIAKDYESAELEQVQVLSQIKPEGPAQV